MEIYHLPKLNSAWHGLKLIQSFVGSYLELALPPWVSHPANRNLTCHRGSSQVPCWNPGCHHDVRTWRCLQHYWPFVRGIHRSLVDSPCKGPGIHSLDVFSVVILSKQSICQSFEMWWCLCDTTVMNYLCMNSHTFTGTDVPFWCHLIFIHCSQMLQLQKKVYYFMKETFKNNQTILHWQCTWFQNIFFQVIFSNSV